MCWRTRSHGRCSDGAEAVLTHSGPERLSREDFLKRTAAATEAAKSGDQIDGLPDDAGSRVTTGQMGYLFNKAAAKDPAQINGGTFSTAGTHDRITIVDRHTYKPGPLRRMRVGTSEETKTFSQVDRVNAEGLTELSVAETDRVFVEATNLSKDATLKISATQRSLVGLVVGANDSVAKNSDGSFSITRTHEGELVTLTITGDTERVLLARGDDAAKQGQFKALSAACTFEEIPPPTVEPETIPAPEPDAPDGGPTDPSAEDLIATRGDNATRTAASKSTTAPSDAGAPTGAPDPSSTAAGPSPLPSTAAPRPHVSDYGIGPVAPAGPALEPQRQTGQTLSASFTSFSAPLPDERVQPTEPQKLGDALADLAGNTDIDRSPPADAASNDASPKGLDGPEEELTFTDITPPSNTARAEHTTPPTADTPPSHTPSERSQFGSDAPGLQSFAAAALTHSAMPGIMQPLAPTPSTTTRGNADTTSASVPRPSSDPTTDHSASATSAAGVTRRVPSEHDEYHYEATIQVETPPLRTRSRADTGLINSRAEIRPQPTTSTPQQPIQTPDPATAPAKSPPAREATTPEAIASGLRQGAKTGATSLAKQVKDAVKEALNPTPARGYEPPPGKSIQDVLDENGFRIGAAPGHPTLPGKALGDERNRSFQQNPSYLVFDGDQFVLLKNNTAVLSTLSGRDTGKKTNAQAATK